MAVLPDKIAFLQGDIAKVAQKKVEVKNVPPGAPQPTSPLTGDNGTMCRLQNIDSNTKATAPNMKKIGPGDIVFRNLPHALAVRGE
ncbi:hypothetical protein [Rosenbergiella metrosideri]|uniref:hypothetical protein n=1 Tax=Rosenbergiella metrosideri TaxID=2921185 RepID=UPI001F4F8D99|nr:hypothetical protein [Rosenbergiella metrosideri]